MKPKDTSECIAGLGFHFGGSVHVDEAPRASLGEDALSGTKMTATGGERERCEHHAPQHSLPSDAGTVNAEARAESHSRHPVTPLGRRAPKDSWTSAAPR
jgi:hypothetical protein